MTLLKKNVKKTLSYICEKYYSFLWESSQGNCNKQFLNNEYREEKIIVTLTSFPGRIHIVSKTIKTLLLQKSIKPDMIILWLAESQFPDKEASLPRDLTGLFQYGLTIKWCEDLRSYKKLIPALREYEKDILVTVDDDVYYERDWLKKLYDSYLLDKKSVHCNKATKFIYNGKDFFAVTGGKDYYREPSFLNKLVGIGGVLYPVNSLSKDVLNTEVCMTHLETNDDIWFWCMAVLNGTRIHVIKDNAPKPIDVYGSEQTEKLSNVNDNGEKLFWVQFENACKLFPEFKKRLIQESEKNEEKNERCYKKSFGLWESEV